MPKAILKKLNSILLLGGLFILCGHFILVSKYLIKPSALSFAYCYPYFHQDWNLFVPPPDANYNLYWADKDKAPVDIFAELLEAHSRNRLKGFGPLLLALSNSIHYFEKQNMNSGGIVSEENIHFRIIEKLALNYLRHRKINTQQGRLILVVNSLDNRSQRIFFR